MLADDAEATYDIWAISSFSGRRSSTETAMFALTNPYDPRRGGRIENLGDNTTEEGALTQDTHEIFTFSNLLDDSSISSRQSSFLAMINFFRLGLYGIYNILQML